MNEELKVFKKVEVAMKKLFLTNLAFLCWLLYCFGQKRIYPTRLSLILG